MLLADWHTYQVLTKRSERMRELLQGPLRDAAEAPQIWWGVSVENRRDGLPRIDDLRASPARTRFLSIEPLLEDLGELDLVGHPLGDRWGARAAPGPGRCEPEWVASIRDQCRAAGVPFFFKQWGGTRKGKAGRTLDGRTYDEKPPRVIEPRPRRRAAEGDAGRGRREGRRWSVDPARSTHRGRPVRPTRPIARRWPPGRRGSGPRCPGNTWADPARRSRSTKLQELPGLAGGHTAEDRGLGSAGRLVEATSSHHLGDALAQSGLDVVLLGFHHGHHRGVERRQGGANRQDEVTLSSQALLRIHVQPLTGEDRESIARELARPAGSARR